MDDAEREEMIRRYGKPEHVDEISAYELIKPDTVDPAEICAFMYRDQEAADAWQAANLEHYGHPSLGTASLPDGRVIGVLDLRPALKRAQESFGAD